MIILVTSGSTLLLMDLLVRILPSICFEKVPWRICKFPGFSGNLRGGSQRSGGDFRLHLSGRCEGSTFRVGTGGTRQKEEVGGEKM